MKTLTVTLLAGSLLATSAGLAGAQSGRHVPADQTAHALPDDVQGGSGAATFSHRYQQGDVAVYVKVVNEGDCVLGVEKQRLATHLRGRDRFTVQPGRTVFARYDKWDFDLTVTCAESRLAGNACDGSVTLIPARRGEPNASAGKLASLEIYSGAPMPEGATCGDMPVDLPLIHVKNGRTHLDVEVMNGGSARSGCTTFEVTTNGSTLVADHAGAGGSTGRIRLDAVEDSKLQARCTGGGSGCQGTVEITLTP